jgi:ABC-type transport system substrate-binding protein
LALHRRQIRRRRRPFTADAKGQHEPLPDSICDEAPGTINRHLIINRDKPPFNNPELRRAMSLSIDRQAFVDIVSQGKVRSAACCNDRPADYGGCCRTSWSNCQAAPPMSRKIALKPAQKAPSVR